MDRIYGKLLGAGLLAPLVSYPGGPGERYFRLTVNAAHSAPQIDQLLEVLRSAIESDPSAKAGVSGGVKAAVDVSRPEKPELIGPWEFALKSAAFGAPA
jgi:hypothetical protein